MSLPPDLDEARDPMVVLPRPWWQVAILGVVMLGIVAVGLIQVSNLAIHDPAFFKGRQGEILVTGAERWFWIASLSLFYFVVPVGLLVVVARRPVMSFGKRGIKAGKLDLAWDNVLGCRWNQHRSGALEVRGKDGRYTYSVPARYRAKVESALGKLGKWES